MKEDRHCLLGKGKYPYTPGSDAFMDHIDFYASENISLVVSRLPIEMKPESHEHDSYEFTVPLSHSPLLRVDKREILVKKHSMTASNPGQTHGPACNMEGSHFISLQANRTFIQNISEDMFGKKHILFRNEPCTTPAKLFNQLREYVLESRCRQAGHNFMIEALSIQIAVNLLRNVMSNMNQSAEQAYLSCSPNVGRAMEYMHEYYNSGFSIDDLAKVANMSKYYFIRVFKAETGKTPYEYMLDIRIQKAKELLTDRQHTISEICFLSGFNEHSHFTKMFKRKTGYTPTEFITNNGLIVR